MSRITRLTLVAGVALSAAALLSSCAAPAASDSSTGAAASDPVTGGTLTYLEFQAPTCLYLPGTGFYPSGGIVNQITDKLTHQDPETLEIEPWIASSWTINDTATEYTFVIRDGVTFSDGTPLDAAAVAANFDTYGKGNADLKLTVSEAINNYDHSEVIDANTVKFYFTQSSPGFLQGTSVIQSGLVSPATLALPYEEQCQLKNIIGSGPFTVSNQIIDKEIDLAAREDYDWAPASSEHQGRAYLDEVKVIVTPEDSVRIGSLLSGQADYVRYVQAFDEASVEGAGFDLYAPQTRGVNNGLFLRPSNSILQDINVRQALLSGTDSQEIVDTIFTANYPRATSVLSSSALGYEDLSDKLVYDPKKANKLLDAAGWVAGDDGIRVKDGVPLSLNVFVAGAQPQSKQTLELVAQQWTKIGVQLNVKPADSGSLAADIKDAEKTALNHSMVGRADQDVIKSQFHTKNRNIILSNDPKLDALLEAEASEPNLDARNADVAAAQEYIIDQAYAIPFFEEPQVYGAATYVKGVSFESVGRPSFYNVWLNK